ncbi:ABC transporter permease [Microbacterium capsulatum]|uniref:ABC transporter permease n=1 Tax=Microbacterium capsulatum TaxID=3041921 RepID=A0ABU0XIL3_9MICO|nr:ABC transporter permease [Microbacterium sp. ASV81]MDQ4214978.1 ABC transporter permease [Microbacterium sp. ASV81]
MTEFIVLPQERTPARAARLFRNIPAPAVLGLILVIVPVLVAILASWIMPHNPADIDPSKALIPPATDWAYPLGTDNLGRDMLSRLIEGSRISLLVGILGVVLAGSIGLVAGLAAGYYGRFVDAAIMRLVDALLAIPGILLILVILGVVKPGLTTLVVVLGVTNWVIYARQIRAEVLELRERLFVEAAKNVGVSDLRIIARHIAPNVMPTFIVLSTLSVATIIITESSLSFLGLGVQPPDISWGLMLTTGRDYVTSAWWLSTFPGLAITGTVLGILLLGDWLRDMLDPRLAV